MLVNGLGAVATGITTLVVLVAKFAEGAWITALLVAVMILAMRAVNRHYRRVARETALNRPIEPSEIVEPIVVMPIDQWNRISEKATVVCSLHVERYSLRACSERGRTGSDLRGLGEGRGSAAARCGQMRAAP